MRFDTIIETVVYDGRFKHYRILNLNSGTVYSSEFKTAQEAYDAIEHGTARGGRPVIRMSLVSLYHHVYDALRSRER